MKNEYVIEIASRLETAKTRIFEMHLSSPSMTIHKIIDDIEEWMDSLEDDLIENFQALLDDYIYPGDLKCIPWEAKELEAFLVDFRGFLINIKRKYSDDMMYSGVINILDDGIQNVNMYLYQVRIAKHKAAKKEED